MIAYDDALKHWIDKLEQELFDYVAENCHSSDGDGDWVEYEEKDEYCWVVREMIEFLKQKQQEYKKDLEDIIYWKKC